LITFLKKPRNLYILLALLLVNGFAWAQALEPSGPTYVAEPILQTDLADLRARLREGGHSGERFELQVTGREAAESIAWFLDNHPEIPFRHPRVEFHPDQIEAWGRVEVLGLKLSIHGYATMTLENGVPIVTLTELGVAGAPVPPAILRATQDLVYEQVDLSNRQLPIIFETLEIQEDQVIATGTFR